jgi:hypothetical protein
LGHKASVGGFAEMPVIVQRDEILQLFQRGKKNAHLSPLSIINLNLSDFLYQTRGVHKPFGTKSWKLRSIKPKLCG